MKKIVTCIICSLCIITSITLDGMQAGITVIRRGAGRIGGAPRLGGGKQLPSGKPAPKPSTKPQVPTVKPSKPSKPSKSPGAVSSPAVLPGAEKPVRTSLREEPEAAMIESSAKEAVKGRAQIEANTNKVFEYPHIGNPLIKSLEDNEAIEETFKNTLTQTKAEKLGIGLTSYNATKTIEFVLKLAGINPQDIDPETLPLPYQTIQYNNVTVLDFTILSDESMIVFLPQTFLDSSPILIENPPEPVWLAPLSAPRPSLVDQIPENMIKTNIEDDAGAQTLEQGVNYIKQKILTEAEIAAAKEKEQKALAEVGVEFGKKGAEQKRRLTEAKKNLSKDINESLLSEEAKKEFIKRLKQKMMLTVDQVESLEKEFVETRLGSLLTEISESNLYDPEYTTQAQAKAKTLSSSKELKRFIDDLELDFLDKAEAALEKIKQKRLAEKQPPQEIPEKARPQISLPEEIAPKKPTEIPAKGISPAEEPVSPLSPEARTQEKDIQDRFKSLFKEMSESNLYDPEYMAQVQAKAKTLSFSELDSFNDNLEIDFLDKAEAALEKIKQKRLAEKQPPQEIPEKARPQISSPEAIALKKPAAEIPAKGISPAEEPVPPLSPEARAQEKAIQDRSESLLTKMSKSNLYKPEDIQILRSEGKKLSLSELNNFNNNLEKEFRDRKIKVKNLKKEQSRVLQAKADVAEKRAALELASNKTVTAQDALDRATKAVNTVEKQKEEIENLVQQLETELRELQKELEQARNRVVQEKTAEATAQANAVQAAVKAKEAEIRVAQEEQTKLQNELAERERRERAAQEAKTKALQERVNTQNAVEKAQTERNQLASVAKQAATDVTQQKQNIIDVIFEQEQAARNRANELKNVQKEAIKPIEQRIQQERNVEHIRDIIREQEQVAREKMKEERIEAQEKLKEIPKIPIIPIPLGGPEEKKEEEKEEQAEEPVQPLPEKEKKPSKKPTLPSKEEEPEEIPVETAPEIKPTPPTETALQPEAQPIEIPPHEIAPEQRMIAPTPPSFARPITPSYPQPGTAYRPPSQPQPSTYAPSPAPTTPFAPEPTPTPTTTPPTTFPSGGGITRHPEFRKKETFPTGKKEEIPESALTKGEQPENLTLWERLLKAVKTGLPSRATVREFIANILGRKPTTPEVPTPTPEEALPATKAPEEIPQPTESPTIKFIKNIPKKIETMVTNTIDYFSKLFGFQ